MSTVENVKYGLIDFGVDREAAKGSFGYIVNDIKDIQHRYITLGFHLHEFRMCEYYKDFGYSSFEEFCEANVPLDKSAISRCINVWYEFCVKDKDHIHCKNGVNMVGCKMFIDKKYSAYSYSQLCEMLPMSEEQRRQVTPDMTIKRIREIKKGSRDVGKEVACEVATSQPVPEKFDMEKFERCRGAALSALVKNASSKSVLLEMFDKNGKPITGMSNVWVDLVGVDKKHVVIRLVRAVEEN